MTPPDDLLTTVQAALEKWDSPAYANYLVKMDPAGIMDWLRALVTRCQQAEAEAEKWRGDYHNITAALVKAEADFADMRRQRDQWKEFAFKHPEVTPPVVTQELAALRSRLSDLTAALVTTEKARDRWHQKYIVEAQARQDEVKILGAELAEERRRHEPPFDAASQNQAPDAVG